MRKLTERAFQELYGDLVAHRDAALGNPGSQAFDHFISRCQRNIHYGVNKVFSRAHQADDWHDAVANSNLALLRIMNKRRKTRFTENSSSRFLDHYLTKLALNNARDLFRKKREEVFTDVDINLVATGDFRQTILNRIDLQRALRELKPRQRKLFILHHVHGFKIIDIAARLGITASHARTDLMRAKRKLKEILTEKE